MKNLHKVLTVFLLVVFAGGLLSSCEKDDQDGAEPSITYIRVTNPESSDSLLVGAGQGKLIAIIGENLGDAKEIWFNDRQARLTPAYITDKSILVSVPSLIPNNISNSLKIIFGNGAQLVHQFEVQISKPQLNSMVSEFVNEGDVATIVGDYFYAPISVTFTGGATAEIVSVKDKELQFKVPAGAQPGPIVVKTNFGESRSNFWFRDNRNVFLDSDPYEGWWNESYVVSAPTPNDPPKISGNYLRYKKITSGWSWNELAGGPASAMPVHSKNIPDEAILSPKDYNLKFEVNTVKPYNNNMIKINVALNSEDNDAYQWKPPFDTKGQWQTVVIPFEDVVASYKVKPTVNPAGYWSRLLMHGPGDLDADIAFDNFRVVPKVSK